MARTVSAGHEHGAPTDSVGAFRVYEGGTTMDQQDHVQVIAQLRQANRLMRRGGLDIQQALEVLKLYEQGVAALLTSDQLIKYIQDRMELANRYLS